MMQQSAEREIRALIEAWADAARRHDLQGILAHHLHDIVMFDLPPPLQAKGIEDYRKSWELFFRYHKPSQAFDIEEMAITAGRMSPSPRRSCAAARARSPAASCSA